MLFEIFVAVETLYRPRFTARNHRQGHKEPLLPVISIY